MPLNILLKPSLWNRENELKVKKKNPTIRNNNLRSLS